MDCQRVREAVPEVQLGRMAHPFAEVPECLTRNVALRLVGIHHADPVHIEDAIESPAGRGNLLRINFDAS